MSPHQKDFPFIHINMNYGTISRKSSGKGGSARLSIGFCVLFLAVYFSFVFFFRYTSSVAFFQYLPLLFIISVLVSLVDSFYTRKAWIPLALQIIFGVVCAVNYSSYLSEMQDRQSEMEKQLKDSTLKAEAAEKTFNLHKPNLTRGEKAKAVLIHMSTKPLLISEKSWRCQAISLSEIQFSDNLQCSGDKFIDGKAGWTGSITVVSGCYFGLFYEVSIPVSGMQKGIVRPDGSPEGNLIIINKNIISSGNALYQWSSLVDEATTDPGIKTLSLLMKLSLLPNKSSRQQSFAYSTWKYVPALPAAQKKKQVEFR